MKRLVDALDRYQRSHGWIAFPIAVGKRFSEDRAGQLAGLLAYYGFFSLFPLMLVLATVLSIALAGNEELQEKILDSALVQFPVLGDQIRENIGSLEGTGLALAVGITGALWAGLLGIKVAQNAMDQVWDVPVKRQPTFLRALLRASLMLASLGLFVLLATFLGGVAAGASTASTGLSILGVAGSFVLNLLVFWVAFRVLTVEDVSWRQVLPGALVAAVLWTALQAAGGFLIGHRLEGATERYGAFAVVIALLTWLYIGAQVTLLSAEVNVVRAKRLWPRSLDADNLTDADRRGLRELAQVEERHEQQEVDVRFDEGNGGSSEGPSPEEPVARRTHH